ncbi:protease modulator HflK N-terminal domain-containing protein [Grimontia marina]|uniref:Menbrane protein HflK N-terminal domain-containing protein n=2 Tax=Grimontia marina TaxID=646534 RepID=A0A128FL48_9GAMM|nr:hypothetical protein GMA8713_05032 [Grimontia marina]
MPNNNQLSNNPWGGNKSPPNLGEIIKNIRDFKKILPGGSPSNFFIIIVILLVALLIKSAI